MGVDEVPRQRRPSVVIHEEKVREQPVGWLMALAEGPKHYRAVRREERLTCSAGTGWHG